MPDNQIFDLNRRSFLGAGTALLALPFLESCGGGAGLGNVLIFGITADPTSLTCAHSSAGAAQALSPKIFDGLLTYAKDLTPQARLAEKWDISDDFQTLTLHLRPGVKWQDGKDFTAQDVAFSALEIWRKYHSRGRMTFSNLVTVDTPDPLTATFRFDKPAPYVISALASNESQVVPRHLYEGRDVLTNPANNAPVGTGPFKLVEWKRGEYIRLERNPDYWDKGRPYLDGLIFRIMGDSASHASALETGEIHFTGSIAPGDAERVSKLPGISVDNRNFALSTGGSGLEFNLELPKLQDVRVRQAVAHAIDKEFILKNILFGNGVIDNSPISSVYTAFHTDDVPQYPFDPAKAQQLLDAAGLKPDADGVRLSFWLDPTPGGDRSLKLAEYIRSALAKVGIRVQLRNQDFATFVKRVYTDRDFEVIIAGGQMGPDPVIGTHRFYWSKSFQRGVAFSNASRYSSPEADRLLEAAQIETDLARRRAYYEDFQRIAMRDLPRIPLFTGSGTLFQRDDFSPLEDNSEGNYGGLATVKRIST